MDTNYTGYIEHSFASDEEMACFYELLEENTLGLLQNQYAILYNSTGEAIDKVKWNGMKNVSISYKPVNNTWTGKVRPRNKEQELAFDLLQNNDSTIKLILGRFGSGKTFLMAATALQLIEQGKYDRIIYIRNNVTVKDVPEIGFLPGTSYDKLIGFAMPIADAVGGRDGIDILVSRNKIVIEPLGMIRGRDFKNSIVFCSECENMTVQQVQLLIGRIGDGSTLWLDGDRKQVDKSVFDKNSGIDRLIDRLKGNELFGYVKLEKTERSKTASLADLLD